MSYVAGASSSLNKTITEIMNELGQRGRRPNQALRKFLHRKIGDFGGRWYKKGFNRGHIQSYEIFEKDDLVPNVLGYTASRPIFANQKRTIQLKSEIKKKKNNSATGKKRPTAKTRLRRI